VNAGHNPALVLRRNGSIQWLEKGGAPVGMFPDSTYEAGTVQLDPGDLVIAYTDGVTEAANPSGEEWGVQGLLQAARAGTTQCDGGAEDLVQFLFNAMDDFSAGCQIDDATLAVLRIA
jgi:phosphoserine phosphatase RsbU/P